MKITLIKPKTMITMKMLTDNLIRPRRIPCLLIAVRYLLHPPLADQEKDSVADY